MELSLICPVAHIEHTALLSGRFCLAPVALKYEVYRRYFEDASITGYAVILDNGIFEDDLVQDEDYINLARKIKPRVLVAPDVINAGADTNYKAACRFATLVASEKLNDVLPKPVELMHVVQCEKDDDDGFWRVLDDILPGETFQWIGICRDAMYNAFSQYTNSTDQELNRFYFAARLFEAFPGPEGRALILSKKWHFLGVGNRLDLLQYYWFIDAMDTASLFYQATLGKTVTPDGFLAGILKRPKDYFAREFLPEDFWRENLEYNCTEALYWAQLAGKNRQRILGGRL